MKPVLGGQRTALAPDKHAHEPVYPQILQHHIHTIAACAEAAANARVGGDAKDVCRPWLAMREGQPELLNG